MYRLIIIVLAVVFFSGCVLDEPVKSDQKSVQKTKKQRRSKRVLHPMSYVRTDDTEPVSRIPVQYNQGYKGAVTEVIPRRYQDSFSKIESLRDEGIDLDLNEPVSRRYLESFVENGPYTSMITLSPERYILIQLDNDIFNYSDRFYTNGFRIDVISPFLRGNPLGRLMVPYWKQGVNYYGIRVIQNIYTPSTTKIDELLVGDRPYAGYLYFGSFKITNDPISGIRLSSELQLGIIGPSSLSGELQSSFHTSTPSNHEPLGWEYQISNDALINYRVTIEKGVMASRNFEINLHASGILGTVYSNLSGGGYFRTGLFNPYFENLFLSKVSLNKRRGRRNLQVYFFLDLGGKIVGYDATLQGGMFNHSSPYTISSSDISRLVLQGSAGLTVAYGGIQLKAEQFVISPEIDNSLWHKWLSIGLTFAF